MSDNQKSNLNTQPIETEKDCNDNHSEVTNSSSTDEAEDLNNNPTQKPKSITPKFKPSIPRYYSKNIGQITIKADKELVDTIKQIAKDEERTIQTVTNRLLEKALDLYEKEREHYLK